MPGTNITNIMINKHATKDEAAELYKIRLQNKLSECQFLARKLRKATKDLKTAGAIYEVARNACQDIIETLPAQKESAVDSLKEPLHISQVIERCKAIRQIEELREIFGGKAAK